MGDDDREIGDRVRQLRKRANLDQGRLGDLIGVDQSAISRMEKGDRQITVRELLRLSEALGVSIDEIMAPNGGQPVLLRSTENTDGHEALKLLGECIDEFRGLEHLDSQS